MNARDPRLDPGVRTTPKPQWENQWDDNNIPRPGFTEGLAPYVDGLDETVDPPFPPVRAVDVTRPPLHPFYPLFGWAVVVVAFGLVVSFFAAIWYMAERSV